MMTKRFHVLLVAGAVLALSLSASAAPISVRGEVDDFEAQKRSNNGAFIASENNLIGRAGFQTNFNGSGTFAPGGISAVFFFQLPALNPGDTIDSAKFSVGLVPDSAATAVTPTFNSDLYVLGFVNTIDKSNDAGEKFFYVQAAEQTSLPAVGPTVNGSVSRIQAGYLVPGDFIANGGTATPAKDTSGSGSASLLAYITDLYDNAGSNGFIPGESFLIMRINPAADPVPTSGTQRYSLAWEGTGPDGNGGAGAAENRPHIHLDVTFIPEPASLAVMGLAAIGLLSRRRSC